MTDKLTERKEAERIARRLTGPQTALVREGGSCVRTYKPAQRLVELGIWEEQDDEYTIWPRYTALGNLVKEIVG